MKRPFASTLQSYSPIRLCISGFCLICVKNIKILPLITTKCHFLPLLLKIKTNVNNYDKNYTYVIKVSYIYQVLILLAFYGFCKNQKSDKTSF